MNSFQEGLDEDPAKYTASSYTLGRTETGATIFSSKRPMPVSNRFYILPPP
jgi:hypothetical protein